MEEIFELLNNYGRRHKIMTPTLVIETDGSGGIYENFYRPGEPEIFGFDSIDTLKRKLSE